MAYRSVFSSHIDGIDYDPEADEFLVAYSDGKTAVYSNVSQEEADRIWGAPSIGSAVKDVLKDTGKAFRYV